MNLFGMIDLSGNAMQAERMRAEVVAANMANAETTRTSAGTPYHRQQVVFAAGSTDGSFADRYGIASGIGAAGVPPATSYDALTKAAGIGLSGIDADLSSTGGIAPGVRIVGVVEDKAPPLRRYDPGHPDADGDGYVSYPDINPLTEMVDLMGATRAYGLNGSAVQAEKSMISSALELVK
jgi:flagellar basal-body rod protein FlgC